MLTKGLGSGDVGVVQDIEKLLLGVRGLGLRSLLGS